MMEENELNDIVNEVKGKVPEKGKDGKTIKREAKNWADFRRRSKKPWTELVDDVSEPFPILLQQILKRCCLIPKMDFQLPLICSMLSYWSPLCEEFFICWLQSYSPGSGKTDVATLATHLYKGITLSASGGLSPSGFKREINSALFHDPAKGMQEDNNEKAGIFCLEDLDPNGLSRHENLLFNGLKVGVKRSSAWLKMASRDNPQEVITFYVGCPKYITTIHKLWQMPQYVELQRRSLILELKNYKEWLEDDFSEFYQDCSPEDLISVDAVDWLGLAEAFNDFWNEDETIERFFYWSEKLQSYRKHKIGRERWSISKDFLATGLACGYWSDIDAAVETIRTYWSNQGTETEAAKSGFLQLLETYIDQYATPLEPKPRLNPKRLGAKIKEWHRDSHLDVTPTDKSIRENMLLLGYSLQKVRNSDKTEWRHQDDKD